MRVSFPFIVLQAQRPSKTARPQLDLVALTLRDKKAGFEKVIKETNAKQYFERLTQDLKALAEVVKHVRKHVVMEQPTMAYEPVPNYAAAPTDAAAPTYEPAPTYVAAPTARVREAPVMAYAAAPT